MRKILLLLTSFTFTILTYSQVYESGVIFTKTDTIQCYLPFEHRFITDVDYKLSKNDSNKALKSIPIEEIIQVKKSYEIFDKLYYKGKPYLLKRLVNGQIKLYEYKTYGKEDYSPSGHYYYSKYGKTVYYIQKENILYKLKKTNRNKVLKAILTGNPEVTEIIDNLSNITTSYKLEKIVEKYNVWLKHKK